MKPITETIDIMASMIDMQKKAISKEEETEQAYISYNAAENACEKQRHVVDIAKKVMHAAEEGYKGIFEPWRILISKWIPREEMCTDKRDV
ncbi:hypothetical protein NEAUS04_2135 [Nematocida ausubeli]|nr:hypothetical protein NEAUS05_2357 [Nematocida ausubeli]KAI5164343.1 hypothetical protein NEAUS04_2135 [Nematocida ausubeli]